MTADCPQNYVGEKCNQVYVKCSDTDAAWYRIKVGKNGEDWYWLQSTDELRACGHDTRGTDHDLDPLPKDKWNFTLRGSLTWEI